MAPSKRKRFSVTKAVDNRDPVVGLDVCGKVYYCHQSTLVNASPYFATRFKGDFDASVAYVDEQGRDVFFVERLPTTFPYIFEYIISGGAMVDFPSFQKEPVLIRKLRNEAEFFGLDGMIELLKVTKTFSPGGGNQGVLYWLGTKKGTTSYHNPFTVGAVDVCGWMESEEASNENSAKRIDRARVSRASFVHYQERVQVHPVPDGGYKVTEPNSSVLWCEHGRHRKPVVLDFKSMSLRPTYYSLRSTFCYGMQGDWNFEGSHDGSIWDTLHSARNDKSLSLGNPGEVPLGLTPKLEHVLPRDLPDYGLSDALLSVVLKTVEQDFRHTWEITPPPSQFYRYFRIVGAGPTTIAPGELNQAGGCLHGEGIELFGDVYEE